MSVPVIFIGCSLKPSEADFLARGKKLLQKKDYTRALLQFKNAAASKPSDPEPYYQAGLVRLKMGDYGSALLAFKKASDLDPKHAGAQVQLAQLMAGSTDKQAVSDAEKRMQGVLANKPDDPEALNVLALSEIKLGQKGDAQKHLEEAVQKFPQNLKAAANLASLKVAQKDFKGAEEVLKKAVADAPKSAKPPVALGRLYVLTHRFDEAEKQFRHALELDPNYGVALADLAELQRLMGTPDQAEQTYKRLAALPGGEHKDVYATFLFERGKRDAAVAEFEKLVRQYPDDRGLRTRLVQAYLFTGKLQKADELLTAALQRNGKDTEALLQRAEIGVQTRKFDQAQRDLESVLHLRPDSAEAHYLLSRVHQARGAELTRRQELAETIHLRPGILEARLELAQCLIAANDFSSALQLLNQAPPAQQQTVELIAQRNWVLAGLKDWDQLRKGIDQGLAVAKTAELLLQDGMLRMQQKDYKGAQASLQQALKQSPGDIRILQALAGTYVAQKQQPMALQLIRQHASEHPHSAPLQYFLGQWLLRTGNAQQARDAFLAAKNANPRFLDAYLALAQLEVAAGNLPGARQILTDVLNTQGENPKVRLALGSIEESANNPTAAVAHYRKVLETEPDNIIATNNLACLLADQGDLGAALSLAQQNMEIAGQEPVVEDTLGWILYQKGIYKEALKYFESAFSKAGSPRIQYHLAMAYSMTGDDRLASQAYLSALKANPNLPEAKLAQQIMGRNGRF